MKIREMSLEDVESALPIYIEQYNTYESGCWTAETAGRRIRQVLRTDDAFSLIMSDESGAAIGFVMGYFKQYDDLVAYLLDEIVIAHDKQHRGYGSALLAELELRVKEKGGAGIELVAVNDAMHDAFYDRAGFRNAGNMTLKCKWFD